MTLSRRRFVQASVAAPFVVTTPNAFAQTDRRPVLTVAVADLPPTLEPALELSNVGTRVTYSLFDTVIRRDFLGTPAGDGANLVPRLAQSWRRTAPNELLVSLRPGVRFHNGDALTAEDVAYTFREGRLWGQRPSIPEGRAFWGVLESVDALDNLTVRFRTRAPDVLIEHRLASWTSWVVNKRHYEAVGQEGFGRNPVGSGPFRFTSMRANDHITFDAHDDYWMGRPTARRVIFREIPELSARIAGLVSGEFDMITNVPPDQLATLQRYPDIDARSVVLANSHVLHYNENGPAMGDKRIRQALNLAIDRQKLVDTLWLGRAVVPKSHNYAEFGDMHLADRSLPFDPDRARRLLREAGYAGQPITYRNQPHYYTLTLDAAQVMVEMWRAVGINANLQVVENFAQMRGTGYQIGSWSNSTRFPDPLGALWVSWGPAGFPQAQNFWKTGTEEFNAAGRALERETELAERRRLFGRMLDIWEDAAPGTVLYQPFETYGVKKRVDWRPYSFFFMDLRPDNLRFR